MPIKRKTFDKGDFKRIYTETEKHPVVLFLSVGKGWAFRADEISKRIKMNEDTVRGKLANLVKSGQVEHKTPYFAWISNAKVKKVKRKVYKKKNKR